MKKNLTCLVVLMIVSAFALVSEAQPAGGAVVQPSKPKFVIGVWYQPIDSFDKWKGRGINTLVGYESNGGTVSRGQWTAAARKAGLSYIIKPTGDPDDAKADAADPNLLAWEQVDEPDGAGKQSPQQIVDTYKAWKAIAANKPVFVNFDAAHSQFEPDAEYQQYCQGADWIGFDYYVLNRGEGPGNIPHIGERLDKFKQWAGGAKSGKKFFVFIECSDQDLREQDWTKANDASGTPLAPKMRAPTPAEMAQEIQLSINHGANGLVYFPDKIGKGWEGFDGVTPELEAVMKQANAKLADAAKSLPAERAPATVPTATLPPAAPLDGHDITIDGVTYTLRKKQ